MARKTIVTCDSCGKEITDTPTYVQYDKRKFKLRVHGLTIITIEKELCEDCKTSFFDWLKGEDSNG